MSERITVLYVFHEANSSGGATYSGMNMVRSLDRTKIIPLVMIPDEGDIKEQMESLGVKCVVAPVDFLFRTHDHSDLLRRYVHSFRRFRTYVKNALLVCRIVKKELADYHIDIVHSNTTAIMTGFVLSKYLRCKHVWHLREFIDMDFHEKPYLGFRLMRWCVNSADATISITKAVKNHWITQETRNAYQLFNAVKSLSSLCPLSMEKEKYFLFCSNWIESYKGADLALKGFCKSEMYKEGYRLVYVGNYRSEYKDELLEQANQIGGEHSIEFVGYCKETAPYYAKATAFLMCSDNEAMGRTTIEAFWNGCLVLGRNTGGTPELIENRRTGYLFDTVDELAVLMREVSIKNNMGMIEEARDFALKNFTEEEYGKKIEKVYQKVMKHGKQSKNGS